MKRWIANLRVNNSVRLRFTLFGGGMLLIAGALLIAVLYSLFVANLPNVDSAVLARVRSADFSRTQVSSPGVAVQSADALERVQDQRSQAIWRMLELSLLALVLVGAFALVFGWLMAGQMLRPVRSITGTARRVADSSLHERIELSGPNDEFKELADTFDAMLDRLHRSFESQRRFVANASHELRTPVAVNRTLLEVTMAHDDLSPEVRQMLLTLMHSNDRSERLIDGLLALARSEHQEVRSEPVDLSEIAADVVEQTASEASRAEVTLDAQPDPAETSGEPGLLERLTLNLVQNAVRYNHRGGRVDVRTGASERPGWVELVVTNTGPVVHPSEVNRLFEPFQRRRPGSERSVANGEEDVDASEGVSPLGGDGAGLGLSIVRSIARTHSGEVHAEPAATGGLVVRVSLPARDDPIADPE